MASGPLSDIRVIDLTSFVAGPYCTKLLADAGAEVIKVERPGVGDVSRRTGPFHQDDPHLEKSALFLNFNTGKQSITLDLKTESGRAILKDLACRADVLVESFRPGTMERLGLPFENLEAANPKLIITSISSFGQSGPYRDFKASEIVLFGMSGAMIGEGERQREPLRYAGYQAQCFAGGHAAAVTMCALAGLQLHGMPQRIDISIFDAVSYIPELEVSRFGYSGHQPEDVIARRPYYEQMSSALAGIHPCRDGFVVFFATAGYFDRVCELIGRPELAEDPRFATPQGIAENSGFLLVELLDRFAGQSVQEVVDTAQAHRIPAAPLNRIEDLFDDPQIKARDYWVELDHPLVGPQRYPGVPFRMPASPLSIGAAPLLGQHNDEVYQGLLNLSGAETDLLRKRHVI